MLKLWKTLREAVLLLTALLVVVAPAQASIPSVALPRAPGIAVASPEPGAEKPVTVITVTVLEDAQGGLIGMYYNRARYLNQNTGRFWTMDTVEGGGSDPKTLHRYLYCSANPINSLDPMGTFGFLDIGSATAIGNSLHTIYDGTVHSTGNAFQAVLFGAMSGKSIKDIVTGYILEETGLQLGVDAWQFIQSFLASHGVKSDLIAQAEFQLVFDVYVLPWTVALDGEEEAYEVLDEIYSPQCLVAGTPIETSEGLKPIEKIRKGDKVWAWNEQKEKRELRPVLHTFVVERNELVEIEVAGLKIVATPDHPFYTKEHQWKQAGQLVAGDALFDESSSGGRIIQAISRWREPRTVYNMEVAGLHNFFVTQAGILTHNVQFNHFFQNSFVKALGGSSIRYGKAALGTARRMGNKAHAAFHQKFNTFLEGKNMRPVPGRSSAQILEAKQITTVDQLADEFRPFFDANPQWKELFEAEVRAIKAGRTTVAGP